MANSAAAERTSVSVDIVLATGSSREVEAKAQLERLLTRYDLDLLIFTQTVRIKDRVIPHSNPVLTLNTRHNNDEERQLATFVHEQLHWFLADQSEALQRAIADLRQLYPEVPVGAPAGARSQHSTYLHLVLCLLEFDALTRYLGRERAEAVLSRMDIYTWIYARILHNEKQIRDVIERNKLALPR